MLTNGPTKPTICPMGKNNNRIKISEKELQRLEIRIGELIETCEQLKEENRRLKVQQQAYNGERTELLSKQKEARCRVEAMINRLKVLEDS